MIGCGEFYNQDREKVWCPRTQSQDAVERYIIHVIGDPYAETNYTHLEDFANFLVSTLLEPAKSHIDVLEERKMHEPGMIQVKYLRNIVKVHSLWTSGTW